MYWRNRKGKRSRREAAGSRRWLCWCALFLAVCTVAFCADKVRELQERFDRETHARNKVKALEKLGEAQFDAAGRAGQAGDFVSAGLTLEKYRDNVRATLTLLKKQEPDADRHPSGYRHLELQVRRGMREVTEMLLIAPPELQPPLDIVRKDLLEVDDELIGLLFPKRTKGPEKAPRDPEEQP